MKTTIAIDGATLGLTSKFFDDIVNNTDGGPIGRWFNGCFIQGEFKVLGLCTRRPEVHLRYFAGVAMEKRFEAYANAEDFNIAIKSIIHEVTSFLKRKP